MTGAAWIAVALLAAVASAPAPVRPEQLRWASPPGNAAVRGAWVVGDEKTAGPYLFRVKLEAGARIPPHTHPDTRITTVLAGTVHVGFGDTFDEARAVAVPTGAAYVAPAGTPHYVWARDGAAEYQESGTGPTATVPTTPKSH